MRLTIFVASLSCLLVACGGGGGKDPILGTPTVTNAPRVISTTPAKRIPIVTGVVTNSMLIAKFSRDMLASTVNATDFTVACPAGTPVTSTVTYDAATRIAKLKPTSDLTPSTTCEARVSTAAKDTSGIALAADYVWRFTTGTGPDNTPHAGITARSPVDGGTMSCLSQSVSVTFSEPMDPTTINAANFYIKDANNALVPGSITYDMASNTATFAVANPPGFSVASTYTTTVTTGVTDLAGNSRTQPETATFIGSTASCIPVAPVALGTIAPFGAFGGGAGATNSGINTVVEGDLGTSAACTLFTGFHDGANAYTETPLNIGEVTGDIFCGPPAPGTTQKLAIATQAAADARTAYNALEAKLNPTLLSDELGTLTLIPGTYKSTPGSFILSSGNLVLNAMGDPNAIWVFQVPSSLTIGLTATPRSVLLTNGAQAKNVFWQVGSAARIENGSTMVGTIIASAGVTISTAGQTVQTTLTGRAIGLNASVTMVNTTIVAP